MPPPSPLLPPTLPPPQHFRMGPSLTRLLSREGEGGEETEEEEEEEEEENGWREDVRGRRR